MPVSGIANFPVLPAPPRRGGSVERVARDDGRLEQQRDNTRARDLQSADRSGADTTSTTDLSSQQRAEAATRTREVFSRRNESENLSFSARKALQAFAANTPSAQQQLGIELAGIDVFV